MVYYLVNIGMGITVLLFFSGYYFRKKNILLHKKLNMAGVIINLATASLLLFYKYMMGGTEAMKITSDFSSTAVDIHRIFAFLALVLMLAMPVTAITGKSDLHKKLHYLFLPLYTLIYISGLIMFKNGN